MSGQHAATAVPGSGALRGCSVSLAAVSSRGAAGHPAMPLPIKIPTSKPKSGPGSSRKELEVSTQTQEAAPPANGDYTAKALSPEEREAGALSSLTQPEAEVVADVQGFCAPRTAIEGQVAEFVQSYAKRLQSASSGGGYSRERCNVLLARELSAKGYQVTIRHHASRGTAVSTAGSMAGVRDTYLMFKGVPGFPLEEYVVELDFRDRFNIANPTRFYSTCLSAVPSVWVGPLDQLLPLVELLCSEMGMAFEERALDMPPWRYHDKVALRWLSPELRSFSVESANGLDSATQSSPSGSTASPSESIMSPDDDFAGLTLTPLQINRTCSLAFDKIDPVSPSGDSAGLGLRKATSLLALHILPNTTEQVSPRPVAAMKKSTRQPFPV